MLRFFARPLPLNHSTKIKWVITIAPSIFVFLFLFIFRPFGIFQYLTLPPIVAVCGYALITLLLGFLFSFVWEPLIKRLIDPKWTMGMELLSMFIHISIIGLANHFFILSIYESDRSFNLTMGEVLLQNLYFTYSIALFPVTFLIAYFELLSRSKYVLKSTELNSLSAEPSTFRSLSINGASSENNVELNNRDFCFAKSSGNYVEYFSIINGELKRELQRNTLSKVEEKFIPASFSTFRTHRSYLVNLEKVEGVTGNAQGYALDISGIEEKVPVSRNKITEFNHVMNDYSSSH